MKKHILLILILGAATILRFCQLSYFPAGLNADEAALGYNAYSLLLTGKDEHGNILPVNLESFADYKPALYSYLLVPVVKIFGLTEIAVRLPSAIFGVLSVYLIYVFALRAMNSKLLAIYSSLILAISPWHIHYSRGAWEVNVATTLILLGIIFFIKWTKETKFSNFALCILNFSLSMYTYQSARILAPVLGITLALIFKDLFIKNIRQSIYGFILLLLVLSPLIFSLFFTPAASRAGGVGLLADEGPLNFVKELRGHYPSSISVLGKILHNRPVIYSIQFAKNYLSHFDGNFLFVNGDEIQRNRVPETGLLYFTDIILLIFGFIYLATSYKLQAIRLILLWLFVSPLASALTFQVPHALRAQNMIIPLTIISAAGIVQLLKSFNSLRFKSICYILLAICYFWQFGRYLHQYYVHYPQTYPVAWEYGFKDMVTYVKDNEQRYKRVLITTKYDQPYILFLFYSHYPPAKFQPDHHLTFRDKFNFSTVNQFDKYSFTDTNWEKVRDEHGSLIIAAADDLPEVGVNIVTTINFPNGDPAFKIVSN